MSTPQDQLAQALGKGDSSRQRGEVVLESVGRDEAELGIEDFVLAFKGPRVFADTMKKSDVFMSGSGKAKKSFDVGGSLSKLRPAEGNPVQQWLAEQGRGDPTTCKAVSKSIDHATRVYGNADEWDQKSLYAKLGLVKGEIVLRLKGKKAEKPWTPRVRLVHHVDYVVGKAVKGEAPIKTRVGTGTDFGEDTFVALTPREIETWFSSEQHQSFDTVFDATTRKQGVHVKLQASLEQKKATHTLSISSAIEKDIDAFGKKLQADLQSEVASLISGFKNEVVTHEVARARLDALDKVLDLLDEDTIRERYEAGLYAIFERHEVAKDFRSAWVIKTVFTATVTTLKIATQCVKLGVSMGADVTAYLSLALAIKAAVELVLDVLKDEPKCRAELLQAVAALQDMAHKKEESGLEALQEWVKGKAGKAAADTAKTKRDRYVAQLGKLQAELEKLARALDALDLKLKSLPVRFAAHGRVTLDQLQISKKNFAGVSGDFRDHYTFVKEHVDAKLEELKVDVSYTTTLGRIRKSVATRTISVEWSDAKSMLGDSLTLAAAVRGLVKEIATVA